MKFVQIVFFASIISWSLSIQAANPLPSPSQENSPYFSSQESINSPSLLLEEFFEEDDRSEESLSGDLAAPKVLQASFALYSSHDPEDKHVLVSKNLISDVHARGPPYSILST